MTKKVPFYLFVIGIFLIIISPAILSEGMFMDGLIYSTIANNLSNGIGTFWNPHFTETFMHSFHEHPPLAIGLQSLFFTVFGESRHIDKLYSLFTIFVVGFIIVKIWKQLGYKNGWLPLLFWILIPLITWTTSNNMMENTMTIFTTSSVLFYLIYQKDQKFLFLVLTGVMLAMGFLTKGFVAFYPWTLPFLFWAIKRDSSFGKMLLNSIAIVSFTLIPLGIIMLYPEARTSILEYLDVQVFKSIKSVSTVDSRFFIVKRLFSELIPSFLLFAIFLLIGKIKKNPKLNFNPDYQKVILFFFLGLTGVLPIMVSMKQSGFYIISTLPFFAIAFGILSRPLIEQIFNDKIHSSKAYTIFKWFSVITLLTGISMSLYFSTTISREKERIEDMYVIIEEVPEGATINVLPEMHQDWILHAYYQRFRGISLDAETENKRKFLLIHDKKHVDPSIIIGYSKMPLPTKEYQLYQLNEAQK